MSTTGTSLASPKARPVDLASAWNATTGDLAARFDPRYAAALRRLPSGPQVFRGLPFRLGASHEARRWLLVDRDRTVSLAGAGRVSHVVVAHFCDSWRDADGRRPPGAPVGWVIGVGEPLARYVLTGRDGSERTLVVRRRFEVDDGIIGWGGLPFAAVGHLADETLDWRGPHPRQEPGRYAPAGHAGPLTILPGTWGAAQTGVADHVPTVDDDVTLWLHSIPLDRPGELSSITLAPLGEGRPGTGVVVAAITVFDGEGDPLRVGPRRQLRVDGFGDGLPAVDLGIAIATRPEVRWPSRRRPGPQGWGPQAAGLSDQAGQAAGPSDQAARAAGPSDQAGPARPPAPPRPAIVDLAVAPDALVRFGDWAVPASDLARPIRSDDGRIRIRPLPAPSIRATVRVVADGRETPARVRVQSADGRYLPPLGHRVEVNPGLYEDTGADLLLGGDTFAYVDGRFEIDLPPGSVDVEVVKGFEHRPVRRSLEVTASTRRVEIELERAVDLRPGGWLSSDSHVHFLAPSTALLQAAAEDLAFVHLLATQWGDHATSVTDLPWGSVAAPDGRHAVILGTENRQNMLGHLALLGARRPILPMASGGGPEGRLADPVRELLADWADRCHAEGGLVVAAHFPLPYAEIAADIVTGRIDAVEMQCFAPGLDSPSILEWYRYLNCGYRLPVVGGTDKMSAEVPVGQVRTYARLDPGAPATFEAWSAAVRAGRTFATSGPLIELEVDGHAPGDVVTLPASGARLEARVRVRAAQPVIDAVEIVVNGRVVASGTPPRPAAEYELVAPVELRSGAWIAARSRSRYEIRSAFLTSMASHTSPVYVEVPDRPLFADGDARAILRVIDGTLEWLGGIAAVESAAERTRMAGIVAAGGAALRDRIERASRAAAPLNPCSGGPPRRR